jgi:hypothetical protein
MTTRTEVSGQLQRELGPREHLLWSGRPKQGFMLRRSDAFLIPFSLFWCGFALFWEWQVLQRGAPGFFALWGVPFVLIGLYIVIGRFFVDVAQRARTFYGLTDERMLIVSGVFSRSTKSLDLESLPELSLSEGRDGDGTITLGYGSAPYGWLHDSAWPGMSRHGPPQLVGIPKVRQVYELIRASQKKARKRED